MLKKVISVVLVVIAVISLFTFTASASQAEGIDYAFHVKGGSVENLDGLIEAFTAHDGTPYARKVEGKENEIELIESVVLDAPIEISKGAYKIHGRYLSVYRGFDGTEPMFLIAGIGENSAALTFEDSGNGEWTVPSLIIDGNSEEFPYASTGMIMMKGRAKLTVNKGVLLTNSSTAAMGGAIFAELDIVGLEKSPDIPEINLDNCMITECKAVMGGGAVAIIAYDRGVNGGILNINNSVLKNNSSGSNEFNGIGGAIYSVGGDVTVKSTSLVENSAYFGGAIYTVSDTDISSSTIQYNKATLDGGAIYCASMEGIQGAVSLADSDISHNESQGVGGAIANYGKLSVSGMSIVSTNTSLGNGGAVYNEGTFSMLNGSVWSNKTEGMGGAVYSAKSYSLVEIKGGEINNNHAALCGAVYCEGGFSMLGGAIGNHKGEAPQIVLKGEVSMGGDAFVQNDVIGLCVTEKDGEKNYPSIEIKTKLTSNVIQKVGYYREKLASDGSVKGYKNATKSDLQLFLGSEQATESAEQIFKVQNRGLLSYKTVNNQLSVRFIFLPIWSWALIALAVIVAVAIIFRKKLAVFVSPLIDKTVKKKKHGKKTNKK
ncbi:MAG: hypothetical protein IKB51_05875 [Clostridia bacterium]|nr:hypothetical protein [Clostridia bacterium]